MPERPDLQIAEDGELLRLWLSSEYYLPFRRLLDDALEDRKNLVLNAPVKSQDDFYAVLEAKGRFLGLNEVMALIQTRIDQSVRARERARR